MSAYFHYTNYRPRETWDSEHNLYFQMHFNDTYKKILDLGCSVGNFIAMAPKIISGADVDDEALKICLTRGFNVKKADFNSRIPFIDESFDGVHTSHVIEHLNSPLHFMHECHRILKPGGKLVLRTPNFRYAYKIFYDDPTHIHPLTRESVKRLCVDAGFSSYKIFPEYHWIYGLSFILRNKILPISFCLFIQRVASRIGLVQRNTLILEAIK